MTSKSDDDKERPCVLGIDIGASSCRAIIFDDRGKIRGRAQQEYSRNTPQPGWVELDARQWWSNIADTVKKAMEDSDVAPSQVKSIGVDAETDGILAVAEDGEPLRPYIHWSDARCTVQHEWIQKNASIDEIYGITGIPLHKGWWSPPALKMLWIRENEPEVFRRTAQFLQIGNYALYRLTGKMVTDYSTASRTMLLDIRTREWSDELSGRLGIPIQKQPALADSTAIVGKVTSEAVKETGLEPGTLAVTGGGDTECSALGAGVASQGQALTSVGTSLMVAIPAGKPFLLPKGIGRELFGTGMITTCHVVPGMWVVEVGCMGGAFFSWFNKEFCQVEKQLAQNLGVSAYDILNMQIEKSEVRSDSPIFAVPVNAMLNLTLEHKRSDIARSILEGVAYEAREVLDIAEESGITVHRLTMVGGGAKSAIWRQIMADVTGKQVTVPVMPETATVGAAMLAAKPLGFPEGFDRAARMETGIWAEPRADIHVIYDELFAKYKQLYKRMGG